MVDFIERKILIGFISSTEFLQQLDSVWKDRYFESTVLKRISKWCWDYFRKYRKAPGNDIEGIIYQRSKDWTKDQLEELEDDILPGLSDEYEEGWDITYLLGETKKFISERKLILFSEDIKSLVSDGQLLEAENLASKYKPGLLNENTSIDLSSDQALIQLEQAFIESYDPVIIYPKALGKFWNLQMVRGGFVALLAPEKRGKTFMMMDMAIRACRQGKKVAFFQAGDMTEKQQLKRMAIHLSKKSDLEKYAGKQWEPVRDCVLNQLDICTKSVRECDFGIFYNKTENQVKYETEFEDLKKAYEDFPEYKPCWNCNEYESDRLGTVWLKKIDVGDPLTYKQAEKHWKHFFQRYKRSFKLATYANGTLTVREILAVLDIWERQDNFLPELIVIDYADLLVPDIKQEFRHQQNEIWRGLRAISQMKNQPLVVTATQADADSYTKNKLSMKNFSEDKRKFAHVTAMYGLNQDPGGREKKLKLMRINEIVVREDGFDMNNQVFVLQNLSRGIPVLGSYM